MADSSKNGTRPLGSEKQPRRGLELHWQILISIVLAIGLGLWAKSAQVTWVDELLNPLLSFGGELFLRLLSMTVIPLVVTSVFLGIAQVNSGAEVAKIGGRTGAIYFLTTFCAILTGLILVNLVQPGKGADLQLGEAAKTDVAPLDAWWELLSRIVPRNPFHAIVEYDMVSIIFFVIVFAYFSIQVESKHRQPLIQLMDSVYQVMMRIVLAVIALAPIGVFCIVAKLVTTTGLQAFVPLFYYFVTVLIALGVHFFINLSLMLAVLGQKKPWAYLQAMSPALLTAFSSASSSATLPLTIRCATDKGGVSERSAQVVLPLGATINMDGTALYEGVAVLFIAQVMNVGLGWIEQITVLFTALLVSIGAAGIPHAGLVMMVVILKAVGLPLEATGLIWAVDRFLDMARTATNVWSDSVVSAIVNHQLARSEGKA